MEMNRRDFLKKASQAAITVSSALPLCSAGQESPAPIPIIDTHQHLWDLSKFKLTWLSPPLDRSFVTKDYIEATQGLHIVKAVYMEVAMPAEQRLQEAEYVIELCKDPNSLTRAAVIAGSLGDDGFESYIMRFEGNPYIKGIRGAFSSTKQMSDEKVIRNLRLLGELGMRFDLNVPPESLAEAAQLVAQCPGTRFVLDHCGNVDPVAFFCRDRATPRPPQHSPEQWKQDMTRLAAKPNIICKISGVVDNVPGYPLTANDLAPMINHCLNAFGPDRVVFGSDWPVCLRGTSLRHWVELLREMTAGRSEQDRRKLFCENAAKFYDLPL
jgi:L-fuconolactonase